jgi:hypothetical protein
MRKQTSMIVVSREIHDEIKIHVIRNKQKYKSISNFVEQTMKNQIYEDNKYVADSRTIK